MSHFAVMVTSPTPLAHENGEVDDLAISNLLAPFHEFECTGHDNEYVRDLNITDEFLSAMASEAKSAKESGEDAPTAEEFARDYYGYEPLEADEERDPDNEAYKYGFVRIDADGKLISATRRTNPNAKWDWYAVGGRWSESLRVKDENTAFRARSGSNWLDRGPVKDGFDVCPVANLDLESMRKARVIERRDAVATALGEIKAKHGLERPEVLQLWSDWVPVHEPTWEDWKANHRDQYPEFKNYILNALPESHAYRRAMEADLPIYMQFRGGVPNDQPDIDEWIISAPGLMTFAALHNGEWLERGEMGWWGIVTDEDDTATWEAKFQTLLASLKPTDWIAIVDCHI